LAFYRWIGGAIIWLFVILGFGFAHFLYLIAKLPTLPQDLPVDGIVVLTGDRGRIASGLEALERKEGIRLLISGVNAALDEQTILNAIGSRPEFVECCIDLGRQAIDTQSNAVEAMNWASGRNYTSLMFITNDYHMPRSMLEIKRLNTGFRIAYRAVPADVSIGVLVLEYAKYLVSLSRSVAI
jgi:uncharacterized SAM-binding protein YcdF (DUF218 family)